MCNITEQEGECDADSCEWRAQLEGFHPEPLDLHGGWMSSKRECSAGCKPGSGRPLEISSSSTGLHWIRRGCGSAGLDPKLCPTCSFFLSFLHLQQSAGWQLSCGRDCRLDRGQARRGGGGGRSEVERKQERKKLINSYFKVVMLGNDEHRQQSQSHITSTLLSSSASDTVI